VGEGWEGNEAGDGGGEGELVTCEKNHVGASSQEDRGLSKSKMGEGTSGAEAGGLK
jgi:hypothetical protein